MTIAAHGVTLDITAHAVHLTHSQLAQALGAPSQSSIPVAEITEITVTAPTATSCGQLVLTTPAGPVRINFAPGSKPEEAAALIRAAQHGEFTPAPHPVPGLDFTAIDVETANDAWGSICQVGAVRFRDGREVAAREWLCTPPPGHDSFAARNISIHGISAAAVAGQPRIGELLPQISDFLGTDVLVAHNAQFDISALSSAAQLSPDNPPVITAEFACSLALARAASTAGVLQVDNHQLPTVSTALGVAAFRHHDATADARAAGHIIAALARRHDFRGSITDLFNSQGLTLGSVNAERVMPVLRSATAAQTAQDLGAGTDFRDNPPARKSQRSRAPWAAVATPDTLPETNTDADSSHPLFGQNVTLTGDFAPFEKSLLWEGIAQRGGQVGKSVTKKTTILVLGTWATKTSKEKRAEELIAQGQDIHLWQAEKLYAALELDVEPPF